MYENERSFSVSVNNWEIKVKDDNKIDQKFITALQWITDLNLI